MSTTVSINTFGGITNDGHDPSTTACQLSSQFDIQTRPHRLTPRRSSENAYSGQDTGRLVSFVYGNSTLYALGRSTDEIAQLFSTSAIDVPSWGNPGSGTDGGGGTRSSAFFVFYHDGIYGASSGARLWQYDIGSTTFTSDWQALTYTNIAQGLVHSQDDILYIPYDNKIASWDGSDFNATALELPSSFVISSISEYGNYLAIACKPISGYGNSRVFLWDRDASLSTVSENIDWGEGSIVAIGQIQGTLVGISILGATTSVVSKLVFKEYTSAGATTFLELPILSPSANTFISSQQTNDGLYFLADITLPDGNRYTGIWSVIGNTSKGFSVVHEYAPDNDTALDPATGLLHGFILIGGFAYIAYETGSVYYLTKTDDQSNYSTTAIRETTINQNMPVADRARDKKLQAVSLSYLPLPSGASATLKYRVDAGDWTTVFTETTDGAVATEMTNANGTAFTDGRNYEFRIESTGGAEISEVKYRYDVIETNL